MAIPKYVVGELNPAKLAYQASPVNRLGHDAAER